MKAVDLFQLENWEMPRLPSNSFSFSKILEVDCVQSMHKTGGLGAVSSTGLEGRVPRHVTAAPIVTSNEEEAV